jgi:ubiquinone biosynthesis protein COQ4
MKATTLDGDGLLAPLPIRPLEALRAFNRLKEDKEDTRQVFEIIRALTGRSLQRAYGRMLQTENGGRQAYLAQELAPLLDDPAWMAQFGPGSVGATFREFSAQRGLSVYGLAQDASAVDDRVEAEHPIAWFARRVRDVHDVWHVLTGYGTDVVGEACILGFTYAQIRNPGVALIALGAAREFSRRYKGPPYMKAVLEGYRMGRRAKPLICEDYQVLLAEPLEKARARLNIGRLAVYNSIPYEARETFLVEAGLIAA